jgi:hypothetical protein
MLCAGLLLTGNSLPTKPSCCFAMPKTGSRSGAAQLSGLNRALALPAVLAARFDRPAALFAPNPGVRKKDNGVPYNYIRPLATIEPTAIRLGLPVNTDLAWMSWMRCRLPSPARLTGTPPCLCPGSTGWWQRWRRNCLAAYGQTRPRCQWHYSDFDSLYVITLQQQDQRTTVSGWKSRD